MFKNTQKTSKGRMSILVTMLGATLSLFFTSCQRKIAADALPETYIKFGSGGGFVGKEHTFLLLPNGRLYENPIDTAQVFKKIKKIKAAKTALIFDEKTITTLESLTFNKPDNIYHYVEIHRNGKTHRLTFPDKGIMPIEIQTFYKMLEEL